MLKTIELSGFKSFGRKSELAFTSPIAAIVGPNGSGKSNVAEAFRFVLGEQSMKSMRGKKGEDLIWGGSDGVARSNRASVKVTFDNASHGLAVDFPEVVIERVVYRDGVNEYSINGSKVRLKDISQLLAQANIGSSGYHIISQGEADRVLSASPRERRQMVEEALGLKQYQNKKSDSEKKLEETDQNLHEASSLRRELAPHLKYLQKQVEKIEKAKELQDELSVNLSSYLTRENAYITQEAARLSGEKDETVPLIDDLKRLVEKARESLTLRKEESSDGQEDIILNQEQVLAQAREDRETASRELGRSEGELSALRSTALNAQSPSESISAVRVLSFSDDIEQVINRAITAEDVSEIRSSLKHLQEQITKFRMDLSGDAAGATMSNAAEDAAVRVSELANALKGAQEEEEKQIQVLSLLRAKVNEGREAFHATERIFIEKTGELREMSAKLARLNAAIAEVSRLKERFNEEVREGVTLLNGSNLSYDSEQIPEGALSENRSVQEDRRRKIERLKIKIEEYRGGDVDEVLREHNETRERDAFLSREIGDLEQSASSLRTIIEELDANIDERFREGLSLIQKEFNTFFTKLFEGGSATLELEKARISAEGTEEDVPAGLSVSVQLPRKQTRGLEVLSGGERALTSIALIFAMSQVNPPPFLILDETDAALDEANSRRYARIVEMLSKRSQLILITHNRATMSAAGELYGVTMGKDGISKLLSVKLEEAERVAK